MGLFGGVPSLSAKELKEQLSESIVNDLVIVDCRESSELETGVIASSISLPLSKFNEFRSIPSDKTVVMVCHSGARSARACKYLTKSGYASVFNLRGGVVGWKREGFELSSLK